MNTYEVIYENQNGDQETLDYNAENILGAIGIFLEENSISIENIISVNLTF